MLLLPPLASAAAAAHRHRRYFPLHFSWQVVVWSKSYCPFCTKAKKALECFLTKAQYTVVELDERSDGDAIQDALLQLTGGRSVPRVFVGGKFIGGGDDTDVRGPARPPDRLPACHPAHLPCVFVCLGRERSFPWHSLTHYAYACMPLRLCRPPARTASWRSCCGRRALSSAMAASPSLG